VLFHSVPQAGKGPYGIIAHNRRQPGRRPPEGSLGQSPLRKVDLHVHTIFSNFRHLKILKARDSYNDPLKVYQRCRAIGADYVAITDHDTIEGAHDLLSKHPELEPTIIVGEEVETWFPDTGQWVHVNVLGVDEGIHQDIQKVRANIYELVPYLRGRGLLHFLNHPLQSFKMQKHPKGYVEDVLDLFTHVELANGTLPPGQNRAVAGILEYARRMGLTRFGVGGSDAHGMRPLGAYMTLAVGDTKEQWLDSVAAGRCFVAGREVGFVGMLGEVYSIIGQYYRWMPTSDGRRGMKPVNYAAAAGFIPICVLGVPLALNLLNYFGTSGIGEIVHRSLLRAERPVDLTAWAPPEMIEENEG
jgi:predicted metal-dependent phosphoesterase TrpH